MNLELGDNLCRGLVATALLGGFTTCLALFELTCFGLSEALADAVLMALPESLFLALSEALSEAWPPCMFENLVCGLGLLATAPGGLARGLLAETLVGDIPELFAVAPATDARH